MRTIKFRGKRVDNGEWLYGDLMTYDNDYVICDVDDGGYLPIVRETVGQFTGLPSQDKQDIYEGDRLFDYDDDYYVVEFSEGRFVAVGDGFEVDLFEIANRCSIIGNIHDSVDECIEPTKLICKSCGRSIEFDIDNEYKPDTCYECGEPIDLSKDE